MYADHSRFYLSADSAQNVSADSAQNLSADSAQNLSAEREQNGAHADVKSNADDVQTNADGTAKGVVVLASSWLSNQLVL